MTDVKKGTLKRDSYGRQMTLVARFHKTWNYHVSVWCYISWIKFM